MGDEPVDEAEVASRDSPDGSDGLRVGELSGVQGLTELVPPAVQDENQLLHDQGPVLVGESTPAAELRVLTELLFDTWHADEDQGEIAAVVLIA